MNLWLVEHFFPHFSTGLLWEVRDHVEYMEGEFYIFVTKNQEFA